MAASRQRGSGTYSNIWTQPEGPGVKVLVLDGAVGGLNRRLSYLVVSEQDEAPWYEVGYGICREFEGEANTVRATFSCVAMRVHRDSNSAALKATDFCFHSSSSASLEGVGELSVEQPRLDLEQRNQMFESAFGLASRAVCISQLTSSSSWAPLSGIWYNDKYRQCKTLLLELQVSSSDLHDAPDSFAIYLSFDRNDYWAEIGVGCRSQHAVEGGSNKWMHLLAVYGNKKHEYRGKDMYLALRSSTSAPRCMLSSDAESFSEVPSPVVDPTLVDASASQPVNEIHRPSNFSSTVSTLFQDDIYTACRIGNEDLLRSVLRDAADKSSIMNAHGGADPSFTPLIYAAKFGHFGIVKLLIQEGVDPKKCRLEAKSNALHFAIVSSNHATREDIVNYLLDHFPRLLDARAKHDMEKEGIVRRPNQLWE
eukprot:GILJ01003236.1.p1 GENE.GILJ01003236.1~~GILJ01003236.1.p1  ORF type:complete len:424 (+),score=41.83 GILJ01003236.1:411-1682(+)